MPVKHRLALIAFGGNAMLPETQRGTQAEQMKNAEKAARLMVHTVRKGYELIIVHGNGPQVGNLLIQMEEAVTKIPPYSLDVCDAMTEGSMGFLLERAITNELRRRSIDKDVVTVVTQVLVDRNDPAFQRPTKPIGPFYPKFRARELAREKKWTMVEDAGRGYRRVVPSPHPIDVVPKTILRDLTQAGRIVVAAGGGGIPVILNNRGFYEGVEAVIDKDLTAERLATAIGAEILLILTDVEQVYLAYGTPGAEPIRTARAADVRAWLAEGQFPEGSMGPKMEACAGFVEAGGRCAIVTSLEKAMDALDGKAGTRVLP